MGSISLPLFHKVTGHVMYTRIHFWFISFDMQRFSSNIPPRCAVIPIMYNAFYSKSRLACTASAIRPLSPALFLIQFNPNKSSPMRINLHNNYTVFLPCTTFVADCLCLFSLGISISYQGIKEEPRPPRMRSSAWQTLCALTAPGDTEYRN